MDGTEADTVQVICRVSNARAVQAKDLFALVDVEAQVGGRRSVRHPGRPGTP